MTDKTRTPSDVTDKADETCGKCHGVGYIGDVRTGDPMAFQCHDCNCTGKVKKPHKADGGDKAAALDDFDEHIKLLSKYSGPYMKVETEKTIRAVLQQQQDNRDLVKALEKIKGGYIDSGTKALTEGYWTQFIADLQQIAEDALAKHKAKG